MSIQVRGWGLDEPMGLPNLDMCAEQCVHQFTETSNEAELNSALVVFACAQ